MRLTNCAKQCYTVKEVINVADYKEMYLHLMRNTEKAIQILIEAQRDCEEMYLSAPEAKLTVLNQEGP